MVSRSSYLPHCLPRPSLLTLPLPKTTTLDRHQHYHSFLRKPSPAVLCLVALRLILTFTQPRQYPNDVRIEGMTMFPETTLWEDLSSPLVSSYWSPCVRIASDNLSTLLLSLLLMFSTKMGAEVRVYVPQVVDRICKT